MRFNYLNFAAILLTALALFTGATTQAQTSPELKKFQVLNDTCSTYELKDKKWSKPNKAVAPSGSTITGRNPPGRKDLVYFRWQNRIFSINSRCLKEMVPQTAAVALATPGKDDAVDLGDPGAVGQVIDSAPSTSSSKTESAGATSGSPHASAVIAPSFRVYFDFDLVSRPGVEDLSFDNYHSFLFFELSPTPDISFSFDVNPTPRYYELDYQLSKKIQLRFGKIWIPFDDLYPHNIYGGRVNVTRIAQGPAFLPDIWTEMGIGLKFNLIDKKSLQIDGNLYVVNGFGDGGKDPLGVSANYPNFSDTSVTASDNNSDKAIGARLHALFGNRFGLGVSAYRGRWSSTADAPEALTLYGADMQLKFGSTFEFRAGVIVMKVGLSTGDFVRGGYYGEIGKRFGKNDMWKWLFRTGQIQNDDRVIAKTDQKIVGLTLLVQPNILQYSLEYSRDIQQLAIKTNYTYIIGRVIMAF